MRRDRQPEILTTESRPQRDVGGGTSVMLLNFLGSPVYIGASRIKQPSIFSGQQRW
jgi:hypothetical protein